MAKKILKPLHDRPGDFHFDYILLPTGYKYNTEFEKASMGDRLRFHSGEEVCVLHAVKIPIESPICDVLCKLRYGISIRRALQIWQRNAVALGNAKGVVDTDECLMITFTNGKREEIII